ncbi:hypothetical protein DFS34DRAFT_620691 [Phlyctochytrium arcticum]|nr:hypothetical protein DFS34DRAFT_620691 [Phlyctochytrium arcticum]
MKQSGATTYNNTTQKSKREIERLLALSSGQQTPPEILRLGAHLFTSSTSAAVRLRECTRAFRALSLDVHPDRCSHDGANAAFHILRKGFEDGACGGWESTPATTPLASPAADPGAGFWFGTHRAPKPDKGRVQDEDIETWINRVHGKYERGRKRAPTPTPAPDTSVPADTPEDDDDDEDMANWEDVPPDADVDLTTFVKRLHLRGIQRGRYGLRAAGLGHLGEMKRPHSEPPPLVRPAKSPPRRSAFGKGATGSKEEDDDDDDDDDEGCGGEENHRNAQTGRSQRDLNLSAEVLARSLELKFLSSTLTHSAASLRRYNKTGSDSVAASNTYIASGHSTGSIPQIPDIDLYPSPIRHQSSSSLSGVSDAHFSDHPTDDEYSADEEDYLRTKTRRGSIETVSSMSSSGSSAPVDQESRYPTFRRLPFSCLGSVHARCVSESLGRPLGKLII